MSWRDWNYSKWKEENDKFDHVAHDKALEDARLAAGNEGKFDKWFEKMCNIPRPTFRPNAFYNQHGNQIEVYLSDESSIAHWLHPGITVMVSESTGEVTGVIICGIKQMIQRDSEEDDKERIIRESDGDNYPY